VADAELVGSDRSFSSSKLHAAHLNPAPAADKDRPCSRRGDLRPDGLPPTLAEVGGVSAGPIARSRELIDTAPCFAADGEQWARQLLDSRYGNRTATSATIPAIGLALSRFVIRAFNNQTSHRPFITEHLAVMKLSRRWQMGSQRLVYRLGNLAYEPSDRAQLRPLRLTTSSRDDGPTFSA